MLLIPLDAFHGGDAPGIDFDGDEARAVHRERISVHGGHQVCVAGPDHAVSRRVLFARDAGKVRGACGGIGASAARPGLLTAHLVGASVQIVGRA